MIFEEGRNEWCVGRSNGNGRDALIRATAAEAAKSVTFTSRRHAGSESPRALKKLENARIQGV